MGNFSIISSIDPEDIFYGDENDDPKGIQENPHLTILYGLHDDVTEDQVKSVFEGFTDDINIEVNGVGIFENDKFDVVKFNVNPDGSLQELHNKLSEVFATNTADHWINILGKVNIPAGAINNIKEAFDLAQSLGLKSVVEVDGVKSVANPITFSKTPVEYRLAPPNLKG